MAKENSTDKIKATQSIDMTRVFFKTKAWNQYQYTHTATLEIADHYKNFKFRELTTDDFFTNSVFNTKNRRDRYLSHRQHEHRCFGFEDQYGKIAAYFWLTFGKGDGSSCVPVFNKTGWLLSSEEAYIWDCRTIDEYRQQGLYREGLRRLIGICQKEGKAKIMISSEILNQASHAGIVSAGFQLYGTVQFIFLGWMKIILCTGRKIRFSRVFSPMTTNSVFPKVGI